MYNGSDLCTLNPIVDVRLTGYSGSVGGSAEAAACDALEAPPIYLDDE